MTGYQEVYTDPSYQGQIVVMTAPMIGNYGINMEDPESGTPQIAGVVIRELSRSYSNWRASGDLRSWLAAANVPILEGVDTRRLTRHLRSVGVMRGVIGLGDAPDDVARAALDACPSMEGLDLASRVTTKSEYTWGNPDAPNHIVAFDFGIKRNILRLFADHDCRITVLPSTAPAEQALELQPNGVFLSNGPGDPEAVTYAPEAVRRIADKGVPIFGICLGHQIIGRAIGATTSRLGYGHHGGNHPVKELATGRVTVTTQNHEFQVDGGPAVERANFRVSHVNLNDGSIEGLEHRERPVFSVQYHPEGCPGPQDNQQLFDRFAELVRARATR